MRDRWLMVSCQWDRRKWACNEARYRELWTRSRRHRHAYTVQHIPVMRGPHSRDERRKVARWLVNRPEDRMIRVQVPLSKVINLVEAWSYYTGSAAEHARVCHYIGHPRERAALIFGRRPEPVYRWVRKVIRGS